MKLYDGIDLHGNNNVHVLADEKNRVIERAKLHNNIDDVITFLKPYKEDIVAVAVESTYNWYWLVDGLLAQGYDVRLANPSKMKPFEGLKYGDDKTDGRWIANMLSLGILPEGYIYPKEERAVRDLLRKRSQLVRFQTSNVLSINNLFSRNTGTGIRANEVKKLTPTKILSCFSNDNLALAASSNLAIMNCILEQIKILENKIKQTATLSPYFKNLITVDGIGEILALTISLEVGDINRFPSVGDFASYCRCVESKRLSNNKKKGKGNAKNGNKYLGWAFVEAANFSKRYNDKARKFHQRKCAKKNNALATKALANKLARACYFIMRDNVPFDEDKCFAT